MDIDVIIAAGGASVRMGGPGSKALLPLAGRPVLAWSLELFQAQPRVGRILVAAPREELAAFRGLAAAYDKAVVIAGGADRRASVAAAAQNLRPQARLVAVHDGARPLLAAEDWQSLLEAMESAEAALLAAPLVDTVKLVRQGRAAQTLDRASLAAAATPQVFAAGLFQRMYAAPPSGEVTDDAALAESLGAEVAIVMASQPNFKLTYGEDMARAEYVLAQRLGAMAPPPSFRVGQGWDSHRLAAGLPLRLGGVELTFDRGLLGHSDGDALLHAIIDALFGAAGLPDIGVHFPDTDPTWQGADSLQLLAACGRELRQEGWSIVNIDSTVVAEQPPLQPHFPRMASRIAQALEIDPSRVGLKAKTAEGLGPVGRGESIEAQAIVLITRSERP